MSYERLRRRTSEQENYLASQRLWLVGREAGRALALNGLIPLLPSITLSEPATTTCTGC